MNRKHRRTLEAVFAEPTSATIAWSDIEALFLSLGCTKFEGAGSRVRFVFGHRRFAAQRPHPQKEAKQYLVREVRDFLKEIGVTP